MPPEDSFFSKVRELAEVTASHSSESIRQLRAAAVAGVEYLAVMPDKLVSEAGGLPMLSSYSSDGTRVKAHFRVDFTVTAGRKRQCHGKRGCEFLCQVGYFRYIDVHGAAQTVCVLKPPMPLTQGQNAAAEFAVGLEFGESLRDRGHRGIAIQHYGFDRAVFGSLSNLFAQRHKQRELTYGRSKAESKHLARQEWVVATPCALHDAHNALKWSLCFHDLPPQLLKDLWAIMASLRNSYNLLHEHLAPWLLRNVQWTEGELPESESWEAVWSVLGVDAQLIHVITKELAMRWDPTTATLRVAKQWSNSPEAMEKISGALLSLWAFRSFSDSRWATIGATCKALVCGWLTGVAPFVAYIRTQPGGNNSHIQGVDKITRSTSKFAVMASLAAIVSDAAIASLFEDSRLAKRHDDVRDSILGELQALESLAAPVWDKIAWVIVGAEPFTGHDLRSETLSAAHISSAFFWFRSLKEVNKLPWTLGRGDIRENLMSLRAAPEPSEPVSAKIWALLKKGFNMNNLEAAVRLLMDVPWTTMSTEQVHGTTAVVKRFHHELTASNLVCRGFLGAFRKFLPELTKDERRLAKLHARLAAADPRGASHITARNVCFKELVEAMKAKGHREERVALPGALNWSGKVLEHHAKIFKDLKPGRLFYYERQAVEAQAREGAARERTREETTAQIKDLLQRMAEKGAGTPPLGLLACKLPETEDPKIHLVFRSKTAQQVDDAVAKYIQAPPAVSAPEIAALKAMGTFFSESETDQAWPDWLPQLCLNRSHFSLCALVLPHGVSEETSTWKVLFAMKSPYTAYFARLSVVGTAAEGASGASGSAAVYVPPEFQMLAEMQFLEYTPWYRLPAAAAKDVRVLKGLEHLGGGMVASKAVPIAFDDFILSLPAIEREPKEKKAPKHKTTAAQVAKRPWLAHRLAQQEAAKAEKNDQPRLWRSLQSPRMHQRRRQMCSRRAWTQWTMRTWRQPWPTSRKIVPSMRRRVLPSCRERSNSSSSRVSGRWPRRARSSTTWEATPADRRPGSGATSTTSTSPCASTSSSST